MISGFLSSLKEQRPEFVHREVVSLWMAFACLARQVVSAPRGKLPCYRTSLQLPAPITSGCHDNNIRHLC